MNIMNISNIHSLMVVFKEKFKCLENRLNRKYLNSYVKIAPPKANFTEMKMPFV